MKLLLHTCCAPCSAAIIEYLLKQAIRPRLFFYNPNIFPEEEYLLRKKECTDYATRLGLDIIDGDYDHAHWLDEVKGLETEPERGARCLQCFTIRMQATASQAHEIGFDTIATTLASSRWKNLQQINLAGIAAIKDYPSITFWEKNWRKDGLSERRRALLEENGFYNQQYCGCEFSKIKKQ